MVLPWFYVQRHLHGVSSQALLFFLCSVENLVVAREQGYPIPILPPVFLTMHTIEVEELWCTGEDSIVQFYVHNIVIS